MIELVPGIGNLTTVVPQKSQVLSMTMLATDDDGCPQARRLHQNGRLEGHAEPEPDRAELQVH